MPYDYKIEYETQGDITDKISEFSIQDSMGQYARELTLRIDDFYYWNTFDFSTIPTEPKITVYTKVLDTWMVQGQFFIEKPVLSIDINGSRIQSLWGRSKTALLGPPFAGKISKIWTSYTSFFAIVDEMATLVGLTFDSANSEISDYIIYGYSFAAENAYPIDIISELAALAGGMIATDRNDTLKIIQYNFAPVSATHTVQDNSIISINESLVFPEFGNRIRITPGGTVGGYSYAMYVENQCLPADSVSKARIGVQLFDSDGVPVQDEIVVWSHDGTYASLDYETSNTFEVLFQDVKVQATNFYDVELELIPNEIIAIYSYSDKDKSVDLSTGYTLDGRVITLNQPLSYCDETLLVTFKAQGIAVNYLTAGNTAEDVVVTAYLAGQKAKETIYIDNPCQCPLTLTLEAFPTAIPIGANSLILAYVEGSGRPVTDGKWIFMSEGTSEQKKGTLYWDYSKLTTITITNEKTTSRVELGDNVCMVSKFPESVTSVYTYTEDEDTGEITTTGSDLYASHNGKVITLTSGVSADTDLVVTYVAYGCALNVFWGSSVGKAKIEAWVPVNREEPVYDFVNVEISDPEDILENDLPPNAPDGWSPDDQDNPTYVVNDDPVDPNRKWGCTATGPPCPTGQVCCHSVVDGQSPIYVSCNAPCDCLGGLWPNCEDDDSPCITNEAVDPTDTNALTARFPTGSDRGLCTCDQMCEWEFNDRGTTQGYDGGSGRSIATIVEDDYGYTPGTEDYNSKYEELKAAAIAACVSDCESSCPGSISYTTQSMQGEEEQTLSVSGWVSGRNYTWTIASGSGSLSTGSGTSTIYTAPSTNAGCSGNPTIALSCDGTVIDTLEISVNTYEGSDVAYSVKAYINCININCAGPSPGSRVEFSCYLYMCDGTHCEPEGDECYCSHATDNVCGSGYGGCSEAAQTTAGCGAEKICSGQTMNTTLDVRTAGMLAGGCCPEALM